ncbi:MAG: DUF3488 and transglutaminase-like domain-containing protein [Polyangiaceae bacterium]
MRFGMVHRVMTDALAALGVIALVASGQFERWMSIVILICLAAALSVRESWQRHPALRHLDTGALLIVLAVQVVRIALDASIIDVVVEFVAAVQIIRLATRKGAAHDQQVIVLALLHLIAGTVLGGGIGYGICFFGVLVVAPGALVLSHLRREVEGNYRQGARDRTGLPVDVPRILRSRRVVGRPFLAVTCLLSVPIFVFTAALFVAFPRVGLSLLLLQRPQSTRMVGFTGTVNLGVVGMLRDDPALALKVEVPNLPNPPPPRISLHLRGTALDEYDGRGWKQSAVGGTRRTSEGEGGLVPVDGYPDERNDPVMRIDLEPIDPPVLFLPPNATGIRLRPRGQLGVDPQSGVTRGEEGEMRYSSEDHGLKYEVYLSPKRAPAFRRLGERDRQPEAERRRYLQLPEMPARIGDLAREWTRNAATTMEKAKAVESELRKGYRYDLNSPSPGDPNPLDHFLFESRRGHCEFYSTAMAVLLRHVGVPTRNVTGFGGGSYNKFGRFYSVRQGDAHSWVEVFVDDVGWVTFDPTPPADALPRSQIGGAWAYVRDLLEATSQRWDRHVVNYDLNQQVSMWNRFTSRYRRSTPRISGSWSSPRTLVVVGAVVALGGLGAWYAMRRRSKKLDPRAGGPEHRSPSAVLAIALYESLETAMSAQGVPRVPSTPPLRHAETLQALEHPLAPEILELTEVYLRARFGGDALGEDDRKAYVERVTALRVRDIRAAASSASAPS